MVGSKKLQNRRKCAGKYSEMHKASELGQERHLPIIKKSTTNL